MKIRNLFLLTLFSSLFILGCQKDTEDNLLNSPFDKETGILEDNEAEATYFNEDAKSTVFQETPTLFNRAEDFGCGGSSEDRAEAQGPLCCCNLGDIIQTVAFGHYFVGIEVGDPRDFEATHWYISVKIYDDQTGDLVREAFHQIFPKKFRCNYYWNYFYNVTLPPGSYHPTCPDYFLNANFEIYRAYNFNTSNLYLCNKKTEKIRVTIESDDWCF